MASSNDVVNMATYVLFGYPGSPETAVAQNLLLSEKVDYEFVPVEKKSSDSDGYLFITRLPTLRFKEYIRVPFAEGLEEIELWTKKS